MEILFLCGYFSQLHQNEISGKTRTLVENAANTFQHRLIRGLGGCGIPLTVISAPFIGPWPSVYSEIFFRGFEKSCEEDSSISYVHFCNIWGYRNISRASAIKGEVKKFLARSAAGKKLIVVYSPHTPFLKAAVYAKKLDPSVHICLVVPDLPQYMNLSKAPHPVYDFFKKIDINIFMDLNQEVDSYVLLTRYMAAPMAVGSRPYTVAEGIIPSEYAPPQNTRAPGKKIAYAGKLMESFGLKNLVEAFKLLDDENASLEICGGGELKDYVIKESQADRRIHYHGLLSAQAAAELMGNVDVLVNPRLNDSEYTRYSFPSKNIEYLMSGKVVVAYMLDGIPEEYRDFFIVPQDASPEALSRSLSAALTAAAAGGKRSGEVFAFLSDRISEKSVAEKILAMAGSR